MKYVCERVEVSAKGVLRMRIVAATRLLNSVGTTTTHCQLALLALVVGVNDTILRAYVCKEQWKKEEKSQQAIIPKFK